MRGNFKVIGIDCATNAKKVGLAMGVYGDGNTTLLETKLGSDGNSIAEIIMNWIQEDDKVILAIDAPLGWPVDLGNSLYRHCAGEVLPVEPDLMFRRETDRFIKEKLGKQPLDVGADHIARTAHAALKIIGELQLATNNSIEIPLKTEEMSRFSVIEVYPAATLQCYGIQNTQYKEKDQEKQRGNILFELGKLMSIGCNSLQIQQMHHNADILDSAVCLLAAKDFLNGEVYPPADYKKAKKEGWIWVKKHESQNGPA